MELALKDDQKLSGPFGTGRSENQPRETSPEKSSGICDAHFAGPTSPLRRVDKAVEHRKGGS